MPPRNDHRRPSHRRERGALVRPLCARPCPRTRTRGERLDGRLGGYPEPVGFRPHVGAVSPTKPSRWLLCGDGLTDEVDDETIRACIEKDGRCQRKAAAQRRARGGAGPTTSRLCWLASIRAGAQPQSPPASRELGSPSAEHSQLKAGAIRPPFADQALKITPFVSGGHREPSERWQ